MIYGYARVSTADQHLDRQQDALFKYGIDRLFCEKMSEQKRADRNSTVCWVCYNREILLWWRACRGWGAV